ncbi:MAG TPA: nucleoside recognition domain-containing protein [Patescibacteria group bacterium]|nr:nucleoside recognition domain-containing protein [Patescibacteria group bacterium]
MINKIWFFMIAMAVAFAATSGKLGLLSDEIFRSLKTSVELAIGLIGGMVLWCGVLKVAEKSGLVDKLSLIIRPVLRLIFNELPAKGNAMGAMVMNMTSNMLGLGNAATPMGLKAMDELQKLNTRKDVATNAMCLFLVINAAPPQFIPATVLSLRSSLGSTNPGIIILPALITSMFALVTGIVACKLLEKTTGGAR